MRNPYIARMLRYYRNKMNWTVQDVADNLSKRTNESYATKTVYGWENGTSQPKADTLMHLCEIYEIHDVLETFGYENNSPQKRLCDTITEDEIAVITAYRAHPELHDAIKRLLECNEEA